MRLLIPLGLLVALLCAVLFLSYFDSIAQYALKSASASIPGKLSVKRFQPTFRGVNLEGVRWSLDDKESFFEAEEVEVLIDHRALLRRDWLILVEHAKIKKPGLRVIVDRDGQLNLNKLLEPSGEQQVDIKQLRTVIEFEDGWLTFNDQRGGGFLYELSKWKGSVVLPDGERLLAKTSAHPARETKSLLSFEGEVSLLRPRVNMEVVLGELDLLPFSSYPGFGDLGLVFKGRVNSSMVVQGNAETWNEVLASLFTVGKVRLEEGFLSSTELPADLEGVQGEISVLGREVATKDLKGKVSDISFSVEGSAVLDEAGPLDARVTVERFSLEKVKPYLENPPDVRGTAEAKLELTGTLTEPVITGDAKGYSIRYQDQVVSKVTASFLIVKTLVHFHKVVAHTAAGQITGEGWVFLGEKIRVLLSMEGQGANPSAIMPDLADNADFRVRVLGSLDDPILMGQGRVSGLGSWAQGVGSAEGRFVLTGKDLMLIDGHANKGSSQVHLPLGNFDMERQQFDGYVSTRGFELQDAPGVSGVAGQVSGDAIVSADLSGQTPRIYAQGRMSDGSFSAAGYSAHSASANFAFDGYRMIVPNALATVEGGKVEAAGSFDLRNQAVEIAARGDGLSLARLGLPGESANAIGTVSGYLGGHLGVYGYANSSHGEAALSGFQRADRSLGGVAWVDGAIPGQQDSEIEAVVVASGTPSRLSFEYTGQANAPLLSAVGPVDVYGGALLEGQVLTVRPTLVTAANSEGGPQTVPFFTYSGAAYPFFGPLLSAPLKKVVVEDVRFPDRRSLTVAGQANLASQRLNLRFDLQTSNLEELADKPLGNDPEAATINETLPFDIVSGFGAVQGVISGTFGAPQVQANYSVPWLLLSNGYENRQSLSSKGRVNLNMRGLDLSAAVSETPYDSRLQGLPTQLYQLASKLDGLMAAKGTLSASGLFDITLATAGFDAKFLALLSPEAFHDLLPYGRLATENLRMWGTATSPSLAGAIQLLGGGMFLAGQTLPFETASLRFSSLGGETHIEDLVVSTDGLNITGSGKRSRNGELSGQIVAQDIDLLQLQRFGGPLAGLTGKAQAVVQVGGTFPGQPNFEIAMAAQDLTWDPSAIGGLSEKIAIEELALGRFQEDGQGLLSGMQVRFGDDGMTMVLPEQGFRLRTEPGALSLEAEGAVRFPGGVPDLTRFKTFRDWGRFFVSPKGPDFGVAGAPFKARVENWTFAQTARLLGRAAMTKDYQASGSGDLALAGQWWRDHARSAKGALPSYVFSLNKGSFSGKSDGRVSGFELAEASQLAYRREGDAGFLSLDAFRLNFFGEAPMTGKPVSKEGAPAEPVLERRGALEAEAKVALTQLAESTPVSNFNLGAVDIPLENLAFMLPNVVNLSGLLESVEVNMTGPLPRPSLNMTGLVTNLAIGPLQNMTLRGTITGDQTESGGYQLSLGDEAEPAVTLSFGKTNNSKDHQFTAQGTADLIWQRSGPLDPSRLNLFSQNLEVAPDSPIDLAARVYDKNLQIIADAVPGKDVARGDLTASLSVNGTLGYPQFEGQAKLADGQFLSERYGRLEGLELDATVERIRAEEAEPSLVLDTLDPHNSGLITRFLLPRLEGTLGKKPFHGGGKAEFAGISPTFLNLFFVGEALPVQLPQLFVGTTDIDLELRGRLEKDKQGTRLKPVLLGALNIPRGDFDLPLGAVDSATSGGAEEFSLPFEYDVTLDLGQEFFVHALDSSVRAVGQLRLLSDQGKPQLFGTVDLTRGQIRIPFYDASFRIRQGLAHFDGPMIPRLEAVEAVADLSGYRVSARVEGRYPDTLSVNLYSDPPLPQAELSRMVVLGGLPSALTGVSDPNQSGSSAGVLSGQGMSLLSGILTNRLTEQIGRIFLLSEVSFDYIPPAQYVIKLAKALDPNDTFLLTLTRVIRDNGISESLYGIEWRLTRTFLTRVALDQYSRARFWIQSINRF